jgi:hypothetical protein
MDSLFLGTAVRQLGFDDSNSSFLFTDFDKVLLSAGFDEDMVYRQVVSVIPKVFFYFHYPAYEGDLLFKSRVLPFHSHFHSDGLTHLMSYQIDLEGLSSIALAYPFSTIKGNYYAKPTTSRRNNYQIANLSTNVTNNILLTNITYIGGITTIGVTEVSSIGNRIDSITFRLRDVDLVFTTLFKL